MFHIAKKTTLLDSYIRSYFATFRDTILDYSNKQWNDEDLKGNSYNQWNINRYNSLLYLLTIVRLDFDRLGNYKDWSFFVDKYKLNNYKKCLACYDISLDNCLELFNLPVLTEGIETAIVEESFIIGIEVEISNILFKDLLNSSNICINNIN